MNLGDKVSFVVGKDVEGLITGIQTTAASQLYRVGWLHNGEYREAWAYPFEIVAAVRAAGEEKRT